MGGKKIKIHEDVCDITPRIQKVLTDTSKIPMKKINDQVKEIFTNIRKPRFEKYKAIGDESKSGRYKQSKTKFKKQNLKGQGIEKIYHPT